jgi:hypothetical protein
MLCSTDSLSDRVGQDAEWKLKGFRETERTAQNILGGDNYTSVRSCGIVVSFSAGAEQAVKKVFNEPRA